MTVDTADGCQPTSHRLKQILEGPPGNYGIESKDQQRASETAESHIAPVLPSTGSKFLHGAKNIVAAGLAKKCEIQIAYAIGVAHPVSVMIDTFGTGIISDDTLSEIVTETFDLRPAAIIDSLDLRRPIYRQLAAYGHMGRTDLDLPWEKTDKAVELKQAAGI